MQNTSSFLICSFYSDFILSLNVRLEKSHLMQLVSFPFAAILRRLRNSRMGIRINLNTVGVPLISSSPFAKFRNRCSATSLCRFFIPFLKTTLNTVEWSNFLVLSIIVPLITFLPWIVKIEIKFTVICRYSLCDIVLGTTWFSHANGVIENDFELRICTSCSRSLI